MRLRSSWFSASRSAWAVAIGIAFFCAAATQLRSWYRGELLRDDRAIERIWQGLRERAKRLPGRDMSAREAVAAALSYMRHRKPMMRYASAHAANLPIGSGATESTCWTMQRRVKRPAQSWGGYPACKERSRCGHSSPRNAGRVPGPLMPPRIGSESGVLLDQDRIHLAPKRCPPRLPTSEEIDEGLEQRRGAVVVEQALLDRLALLVRP